MTSAYLQESLCWKVAGVRKAAPFFRALSMLVPEATHMFLEGSPVPEVQRLLADAAADPEYGAPAGTIWSWPQKNRRWSVRASSELFAQLADAASRLAEPEVCDHLHLYRGDEALVQWFDAFSVPMLVSKTVARERVERFASAVRGVLAEGT